LLKVILVSTSASEQYTHKLSLSLIQLQELYDLRHNSLQSVDSIVTIIKIIRLLYVPFSCIHKDDSSRLLSLSKEVLNLHSSLLNPSNWFYQAAKKSPSWVVNDISTIYTDSLKSFDSQKSFKIATASADTIIRLFSCDELKKCPISVQEIHQAFVILNLETKNPIRDYVFLILFDIVHVACLAFPDQNWKKAIDEFVICTFRQVCEGNANPFRLFSHLHIDIFKLFIPKYLSICSFSSPEGAEPLASGMLCFNPEVSSKIAKFGCSLANEALSREQKKGAKCQKEYAIELISLLSVLKKNLNWFKTNAEVSCYQY
jgi:hypothetical protein